MVGIQNKGKIHLYILILTILLSAYLHREIFNKDLIGVHLWRQAQNEWYVRNFLRNDNNILNPRIPAHNMGNPGNILRYEFPLMQWSIAQVKRVCGDRIIFTRLFMFCIGILCILGFYYLIRILINQKIIASVAAYTLCFSPLFYYYMVNPMSDICAFCAQIWMTYYLIKYYKEGIKKDFLWCCFFLMLSGLFKLPFYMFGIMPFVFILINYFKKDFSLRSAIAHIGYLFLFSLPVIIWYAYAIKGWGYMGVLKGVTADVEPSELWKYLKFVLVEWFPMHIINPYGLVLLAMGFYLFVFKKEFDQTISWILLSAIIISILYYGYELNMIAKVHDYYMLPFVLWMHILIASAIHSLWELRPSILIFLLSAMPVFAYNQIRSYWDINRNGYKVDWFYHQKELQEIVPRDSLCIILNDNTGTVIPYVIDKQGFVFDKNELPSVWVEDMIINRRARYLYSDSRFVDTNATIKPFLEKLLLERGEVKVFKLVEMESTKKME